MNDININTINQIINQSKQLPSEKIIKRNDYHKWLIESTNTKLIKILTGFRRVGKSTLLKTIINELIIENKTVDENIFYINFDIDISAPINTLEKLRATFELFTNTTNPNYAIYVILDEIQNIKNWESFVRSLHETKNIKYLLQVQTVAFYQWNYHPHLGKIYKLSHTSI